MFFVHIYIDKMVSLADKLTRRFGSRFSPENLRKVVVKLQSIGVKDNAIAYYIEDNNRDAIDFLAGEIGASNFLLFARYLGLGTTDLKLRTIQFSKDHQLPLWLAEKIVRKEQVGSSQLITFLRNVDSIFVLPLQNSLNSYFVSPHKLECDGVNKFPFGRYSLFIRFYPSVSAGKYLNHQERVAYGHVILKIFEVNDKLYLHIDEVQRWGSTVPFRRYATWPHIVIDIIENAAKKFGCDRIFYTTSEIITERWGGRGMPHSAAKFFYEDVPTERHYTKDKLSDVFPTELISDFPFNKAVWVKRL